MDRPGGRLAPFGRHSIVSRDERRHFFLFIASGSLWGPAILDPPFCVSTGPPFCETGVRYGRFLCSQSRLRLVVLVLFVLQDLEPIIILSFFLVFYLYVPQFPFLVLKANEDVWPARGGGGGGVQSRNDCVMGTGCFTRSQHI